MAIAAAVTLAILIRSRDGPLERKTLAANGAASVIVDRSVSLGLDFDSDNPDGKKPSAEDTRALSEAGVGAWLDAQIAAADGSIAEPPRALGTFLDGHRESLWAIVSALQKQSPEWSQKEGLFEPVAALLPTIRLEKVLLAAALCEERAGNSIDADRALEASWSLERPLISREILITQLVAAAIEKLRAGVLRKIDDPPILWLGRLGSGGDADPWKRMLSGILGERELLDAPEYRSENDPFAEVVRKVPPVLVDVLRKAGPCEAAAMSNEEAWHLVQRGLPMDTRPEAPQIREMYGENSFPAFMDAARRVARVAVDRELTLKILELRVDKRASPDNHWPEKLTSSLSDVCAGSDYSYRSDRNGMEVRFEGTIVEPSSGVTLPLSFRIGKAQLLPTVKSTPTRASPPKAEEEEEEP
jgi:hypothetical protein